MPWGSGMGTGTNLSVTTQQTWVSCFPSLQAVLGNSWNTHTGWKGAGVRGSGGYCHTETAPRDSYFDLIPLILV